MNSPRNFSDNILSSNTLHFETESDEQGIETERTRIEEYQKKKFIVAPVQDPFTECRSKTLGLGNLSLKNLDFTPLVSLRRQHQTRHAASGIRTQQLSPNEVVPETTRIRRKILQELWQVLKLEEDVAPGSGVERNTRWTGVAKTLSKGNASNAAVVSDMDAKKVQLEQLEDITIKLTYIFTFKILQKRRLIFGKIPLSLGVAEAGVTLLRPLVIGDFGIVHTAQGLFVGCGIHIDFLYCWYHKINILFYSSCAVFEVGWEKRKAQCSIREIQHCRCILHGCTALRAGYSHSSIWQDGVSGSS